MIKCFEVQVTEYSLGFDIIRRPCSQDLRGCSIQEVIVSTQKYIPYHYDLGFTWCDRVTRDGHERSSLAKILHDGAYSRLRVKLPRRFRRILL